MAKVFHPQGKLKLHGFNNLTKSLSFNLYDVCYAQSVADQQEYIAYIDEEYNAERLTDILTECVNIIGAHILNIALQDYEPQGASVTVLIAEEPIGSDLKSPSAETVVAHLDKSHICVHTYPEMHPHNGISSFRADIELATCGEISPLKALDYLLSSFDADVVNVDYRIRGFTRDTDGTRHYMDHDLTSIQDFIDPEILKDYQCIDTNIEAERLYHTKMRQRELDLDRYVFGGKHVNDTFSAEQRREITEHLKTEIQEIYYGHNVW